ncbi:hypothetical protein [Alkanindiges illinoisensis]|uniref:Uncharacterized protein n=1 Tax=Alkanindiges illinoisensis TaxID=197183 RepID=A0A4Y7X8U4_9GAMM|nr:hypothetical protein [Alkanindiges illinoisensis]TEU23370.1 hypothetical protein E2B99_13725 [Alkanindiges illinoisensis]
MATVTKNQFRAHQYGATPYGNMSSLAYSLKTDATGKPLESDATAALAVGDVVDLGLLQEGWRLEDASIFITTAMTASVTGSLGFKYEDGVDDTKVPQDAAYFISGGSLAAAGRLRANTGKLVTLPKPARLILTIAGATNAKASDIKVVVQGEMKGPR